MNDSRRLRDKVAIITGAAHGIGRAIAEVFAEAGARVLIADVDDTAGEQAAAGIRAQGGKATFLSCDVSSETEVRRAVGALAKETGRVDVLCNNAAYISDRWNASAEAAPE